jgi:hypothetical protein
VAAQPFYAEGPHTLLQVGLRVAHGRGKMTVTGIPKTAKPGQTLLGPEV